MKGVVPPLWWQPGQREFPVGATDLLEKQPDEIVGVPYVLPAAGASWRTACEQDRKEPATRFYLITFDLVCLLLKAVN